jgi:hypothetical protein
MVRVNEINSQQKAVGNVGQDTFQPATPSINNVLQRTTVHVFQDNADVPFGGCDERVVKGHNVGARALSNGTPRGGAARSCNGDQILVQRFQFPHHLMSLVLVKDRYFFNGHDPQTWNVDSFVHNASRPFAQHAQAEQFVFRRRGHGGHVHHVVFVVFGIGLGLGVFASFG